MNPKTTQHSITVSIVIPCFNHGQYIQEALDSIDHQKINYNIQVIIVDDGSDDGTSEFIHSNYPNLKYIFQSNSGVSAARNTGIKAASSNWIAFLDSDDAWVTNKIQKQITELELNPDFSAASLIFKSSLKINSNAFLILTISR